MQLSSCCAGCDTKGQLLPFDWAFGTKASCGWPNSGALILGINGIKWSCLSQVISVVFCAILTLVITCFAALTLWLLFHVCFSPSLLLIVGSKLLLATRPRCLVRFWLRKSCQKGRPDVKLLATITTFMTPVIMKTASSSSTALWRQLKRMVRVLASISY